MVQTLLSMVSNGCKRLKLNLRDRTSYATKNVLRVQSDEGNIDVRWFQSPKII